MKKWLFKRENVNLEKGLNERRWWVMMKRRKVRVKVDVLDWRCCHISARPKLLIAKELDCLFILLLLLIALDLTPSWSNRFFKPLKIKYVTFPITNRVNTFFDIITILNISFESTAFRQFVCRLEIRWYVPFFSFYNTVCKKSWLTFL